MAHYGELVLLEDHPEEGWARITLNRPEKRNAMSSAAQAELRAALAACKEKSKAVIITASGPAFCAGIDLKERRDLDGARPRQFAYGGNSWAETNWAIRTHPAVCIAAVNGLALGGGITLINACDLAIAAEEASIGMPEMGFATYPGLAGPSTQLRLLPKHAAWLVLTAKRIDGRTAERWGLVNQVVPLAELQAAAEALARHVAQFDATALEYSKRALATIPFEISDWQDAIHFGGVTNAQIRALTSAASEGLTRFASGARNPGQGS